MAALPWILLALALAALTAVLVRGYFKGRLAASESAQEQATAAAAGEQEGRVAAETRANAEQAADYAAATQEARNVTDPSVALARWRRLRRLVRK